MNIFNGGHDVVIITEYNRYKLRVRRLTGGKVSGTREENLSFSTVFSSAEVTYLREEGVRVAFMPYL